MTNKTKDLVAAGHALAKELHCAESAALVRELATQLDVQRVRADELAEVRANVIKAALDDCTELLDRDCIMESNGISYEDAALREKGAMALHSALLRQGGAA